MKTYEISIPCACQSFYNSFSWFYELRFIMCEAISSIFGVGVPVGSFSESTENVFILEVFVCVTTCFEIRFHSSQNKSISAATSPMHQVMTICDVRVQRRVARWPTFINHDRVL